MEAPLQGTGMSFTPRRLASSLSFAILLYLVPTYAAAEPPASKTAGLDTFTKALSQIQEKYVDQVDESALIEAAIEGMVRSLDRHSRYFEPDRLEAERERLRGEYGGVGLRLTEEDGWIKVLAPQEGTPAFRAGIRAGDVITRLNGASLHEVGLSEAIRRMRGPSGSKVAMTIRRDGVDEPFEVTLTRETINFRSVRYHTEGRIGYIRITRFDRQTQRGLEEAIAAIKSELGDHLLGYILDLRDNPGGLVSQAVSVADSFLNSGRILTTRGRHSTKNKRYDATPGDLADGRPMVVLINGRSASASEIVAGALRDHHRALLLGSRSYGKGTVQSTISLDNEGAIRITTARYYTPSGRSIHEVGITPDVIVDQSEAEASARDHSEEIAIDARSGAREADAQLARALKLVCGMATVGKAALGETEDRSGGDGRVHHALPSPATVEGQPLTTASQAGPAAGEEASMDACTGQAPFVAAALPNDI